MTTLEIRDIPKGLHIHVTEPRRIRRILIVIAIGLGFGIFLYRSSFDSRLSQLFFGALFAYVINREIFVAFRGTDVHLTVTNLDLISTGHAPDGYHPSTISRADIYNLTFSEGDGDGDGGEDSQPSGLYVEYRGGLFGNPNTCVLPHLDTNQTEQVIQAILHRFPDTTTLPPTRPNDPGLIILNLTQPSPSPPSSST